MINGNEVHLPMKYFSSLFESNVKNKVNYIIYFLK